MKFELDPEIEQTRVQLSDEEEEVFNLTVKVFNKFGELPEHYDTEMMEFAIHHHNLQRMILSRPIRRIRKANGK